MAKRIGIGIVTYNRCELLASTIERVRALTRHSDIELVVADDGSRDGTLEMLRREHVPMVTGVNMGIAWNKNRALYFLNHMLMCDVVVLLEDDTQPARMGWEAEWIEAAERWGHVNYAGSWLRDRFLSGAGTAADPVRATAVTAQCASYSRRALSFGGYFDSRFRGYGHEHVEHTRRLIRVGYGGSDERLDGQNQVVFKLIHGNVSVRDALSFNQPQEVERNLQIAGDLMADETYRMPWRNDQELRQFRAEMDSAIDRRSVTPPQPGRRGLGWLLGRRR